MRKLYSGMDAWRYIVRSSGRRKTLESYLPLMPRALEQIGDTARAARIARVGSSMKLRLWITRISAAAKMHGTSYSKLMGGLNKAGVELDRKVLANMAILDPNAFSEVVKIAAEAHA